MGLYKMGPSTKYYLNNFQALRGIDKIHALGALEVEILTYSMADFDTLMKDHESAFPPNWGSMMRKNFSLNLIAQIPLHELSNKLDYIHQVLNSVKQG